MARRLLSGGDDGDAAERFQGRGERVNAGLRTPHRRW